MEGQPWPPSEIHSAPTKMPSEDQVSPSDHSYPYTPDQMDETIVEDSELSADESTPSKPPQETHSLDSPDQKDKPPEDQPDLSSDSTYASNQDSHQHWRYESFSRSRDSIGAVMDPVEVAYCAPDPEHSGDSEQISHPDFSEYDSKSSPEHFQPEQFHVNGLSVNPSSSRHSPPQAAKDSHSSSIEEVSPTTMTAPHEQPPQVLNTGPDHNDHAADQLPVKASFNSVSTQSYPTENAQPTDHHAPEPVTREPDTDQSWSNSLAPEHNQNHDLQPTDSDQQSLSIPHHDDESAEGNALFDGEEDDWTRELKAGPAQSAAAPGSEAQPAFATETAEHSIGTQTLHKPSEQSGSLFNTTESAGGLEDSWAEALKSNDKGLDEAWGAAFGDDLNDDVGLLEDETPPPRPLQKAPQPPSTNLSNQYHPSVAPHPSNLVQQQPPLTTAYNAPPPIQQTTSPQDRSAGAAGGGGGMKFFEDLPMTQSSRSRKAKPQLNSLNQPSIQPPPPPRGQIPPMAAPPPPQNQSSATSLSSRYGRFQPPERLDPFPPQPTVPPPTNSHLSTPQTAIPPSMNQRYSPAPSQTSSSPSRYSAQPLASAPPSNQRYSPGQAPKADLTVPPPSKAAYSPAPSQGTPSSSYAPSQTQSSYFPPQAGASKPPGMPPRQDSRYSPAPPLHPIVPPKSTTSPPNAFDLPPDLSQPSQGPHPPSSASTRFAPRTSSPLAQPDHQARAEQPQAGPPRASQGTAQQIRPMSQGKTSYAPQDLSSTLRNVQSHSAIPYSPELPTPDIRKQSMPSAPPTKFEPPARPRTQSPDASKRIRSPQSQYQPQAPTQSSAAIPSTAAEAPRSMAFRPRQPSLADRLEFLEPADTILKQDPLQRWKGCPSINWTTGGMVVGHFPRRLPVYGGGQTAPALKCSGGDIKLHKIKDFMPADGNFTSFPGPLKSKSKKKEIMSWLTGRIENLQREQSTSQMLSMDARIGERIILWRVVQILVEHDGVLTGNPAINMEIRQALSISNESPTPHSAHDSGADVTDTKPDGISPGTANIIRQSLLGGDREKAIWEAVDHRLWGHAMLLSSTVNPSIWKQVVHEFVRKEVRGSKDNESLAALFEVFGGNWEESIDELVPASARAGFQMMSVSDNSGKSQDVLNGLNKWQETLSLVLNNRSPEDEKALVALGRLLRGYGRIEAAHVCFLFARPAARLGGVDDAEADFTLLATVASGPGSYTPHDMDAILLSEVYEFALSLAPTATSHYIPHLQAYKLHHAHALAGFGQKEQALQYCDALSSAIRSSTKLPPYYHTGLVSQIDDLNRRLSQAPKDGASSWISKPSIGKVSGTMWAKFNSFVAGDDGETASNGSAPQSEPEIGPFARIPGGTPTVSRSASHVDLHASGLGAASSSGNPVNSRYAPSYMPQQSQAHLAPSYNPYHTGSPLDTTHPAPIPIGSSSSNFDSPVMGPAGFGQSHRSIAFGGYGESPASNNSAGSYMNPPPPDSLGVPPVMGISPQSDIHETMSFRTEDSHSKMNGYMPMANGVRANDSANQASLGGYEPPTGAYAPPSYESGSAVEPYSPVQTRQKKSIMDAEDDDGLMNEAANMKQKGRASAIREPDDAVRRAAEEDGEISPPALSIEFSESNRLPAARDKAAKEKKGGGWLGGWFSKKDPNAPTIHKAKLGEENSFYYDNETKKWVNKKGGSSDQVAKSSAPPPPPRGPPSRAASGAGTPDFAASGPPPAMGVKPPSNLSPYLGNTPSMQGDAGPPSRSITPARSDSSMGTGTAEVAQPASLLSSNLPSIPGSNPPSAPPSRPGTSMSNASSIDDLLGAPGARKGGTMKKGKKGARYVDVMGKGGE